VFIFDDVPTRFQTTGVFSIIIFILSNFRLFNMSRQMRVSPILVIYQLKFATEFLAEIACEWKRCRTLRVSDSDLDWTNYPGRVHCIRSP